MGISVETLAVAKKYTDNSMAGAGAVAGVPCKIQSIAAITGGNRVTFLWTDNNGDDHTSTMDVMNGDKGDTGATGATGKGIKSMAINGSAHLIVTYTDDTTQDAGEVPTVQADWNEASTTADSYIKNKPELGTAAAKDYTPNVAPNNHDLVESNAVYNAINTALSSVYTPRGDLTCAELTSSLLIADNVGSVYEMSDSGTTTDLFLQGAGKTISVGSNVGIIQTGVDTYKFNLMANSFDLHDYQKKALETPITIGGTSQTTVEGALGALNTAKAEKSVLDNEVVTRATLGAHNLLNIFNSEINVSGTYTEVVNSDGTVTIGGTPTSACTIPYKATALYNGSVYNLEPSTNYVLDSGLSAISPLNIQVFTKADASASWTKIAETTSNTNLSFTTPSSFYDVWARILVPSNAVVPANTVVKPQIRLATDADTTYRPYVPTNAELLSYEVNGVLGAKNYCPKVFTSGSHNGITYTANDDGSVRAAGTIGAGQTYSLLDSSTFTLKAGRYILSGNPVPGLGADTKRTTIRLFNGSTVIVTVDSTTEREFSLDSNTTIYVRISLNASGKTYDDVFYPMIRLISDTDNTYQPYAMTNRELTEVKTAVVAVPSTYTGGSSNLNFRRVGKVVECFRTGSSLKIPTAGQEYEIASIPDGFVPTIYDRVFTVVDMNNFTSGAYIKLATSGKICIYGYQTSENQLLNATFDYCYIID